MFICCLSEEDTEVASSCGPGKDSRRQSTSGLRTRARCPRGIACRRESAHGKGAGAGGYGGWWTDRVVRRTGGGRFCGVPGLRGRGNSPSPSGRRAGAGSMSVEDGRQASVTPGMLSVFPPRKSSAGGLARNVARSSASLRMCAVSVRSSGTLLYFAKTRSRW